LNRSLYGLKQAPRAWYQRFATFITSIGFMCSCSDTVLFFLQCVEGMTYLLLYVNNIFLTASSTWLLDWLTTSLRYEFAMTDMGCLLTSQDVRLEIERKKMCALHSCIKNLGNFRAFN
jgi:hypothetical protein